MLKPVATAMTDKLADVRKTVEICFGEILKVCGHEMVRGMKLLCALFAFVLQIRLESIEAVTKILEEANKRIQPTGTVELFGSLRGRLYDSNKNLIMAIWIA